MENLTKRLEKLVRSSQACKRSIRLYKNPREDATDDELEAFVTSVIKNYELLYEVLWKYLKYYLNEKLGKDIQGSKTIFRTCLEYKLINESELLILLELVDQRNTTAHVYDEATARIICEEIMSAFIVIEKLVERLKENQV